MIPLEVKNHPKKMTAAIGVIIEISFIKKAPFLLGRPVLGD
jgi:hypothetical protein